MAIQYAIDVPNGTAVKVENGFLLVSGWAFSDCSEMKGVEVLYGKKSVPAEIGFPRADVLAAFPAAGDFAFYSGFSAKIPFKEISVLRRLSFRLLVCTKTESEETKPYSIGRKRLLKEKVKSSFLYRKLHLSLIRRGGAYLVHNGFFATVKATKQFLTKRLRERKSCGKFSHSPMEKIPMENAAYVEHLYKKNENLLDAVREQVLASEVISFDVFDTLLCRLVSKPTDVFKIMESQLGIADFSKMREKFQSEASALAEITQKIPHCDLKDIYDYIAEHSDLKIDWKYVETLELTTEEKLLVANPEMKKIYDFALANGKRIIAVSDMYIHGDFIQKKLHDAGFEKFDKVYVSTDCHKAKFKNDMFPYVLEQEKCAPNKIFHIGDNQRDDFEFPSSLGINAFHYKRNGSISCPTVFESISKGIVNAVSKKNDDFFYRLGANVGGPVYAYLLQWFMQKAKSRNGQKIFFLSRDGYNLFTICKELGLKNIAYLHSSRRALLLAGIDFLGEEELSMLPPFSFGQSVREIVDYLGMDFVTKEIVKRAGFSSFDDLILNENDFIKFRKIYRICEQQFLSLCAEEREFAALYFKKMGLLDADCTVFDCGWNGSSQYLLQKVLGKIGAAHSLKFLYAGIFDTGKSRRQLSGLDFETCFFGFGQRQDIVQTIKNSIVLFELFFTSPENSVLRYTDSDIEFETIETAVDYKKNILAGIKDFLSYYKKITDAFEIPLSVDDALEHLLRLMAFPSEKEAVEIGRLENVDGFVAKRSEKKYLAKISDFQIKKENFIDIYWPSGILANPENSKFVKNYVRHRFGNGFSMGTIPAKNETVADFDYQDWILKNECNILETPELTTKPLFSVVVPVYNVLSAELRECIESVRNQTYENWELCLVDDASTWKNVNHVLETYRTDGRIKIARHETNAHISKTTNDAIKMSHGDFIAFLDCDDVLAPNALFEVAKKLSEDGTLDFIYSDEDKLSLDGNTRKNPFFKPDWSPDTFMSLMYTCHFSVYRKSVVEAIGGLREGLEGAQDYDFTLRFTEKTQKIAHISKILYHWRERPQSIASNPNAKPYALKAIKKLKEEALERRGLNGTVAYCPDVFQYRVKYFDKSNPLASIIIPSKDHFDIFERCIKSVRKYTEYKNYEIIVVDNGSSEKNKKGYLSASSEYGFKYIYEPMDFNFSRMCNIGAKNALGKVLVFLNNDIEVAQSDWLDLLVGHATVPGTGAVGAKLLYPNSNVIQHIGVVNLEIGPTHAFIGFADSVPYYYCINRLEYNFSAVTAACLAVSKENFELVGGFDENLSIAYNDVDFCFKLVEQGLFNVVRNDVTLTHHESISRGLDGESAEKLARLKLERKYLYERHPAFSQRDSFYNQNLTQNRCDFKINEKIKTEAIHGGGV